MAKFVSWLIGPASKPASKPEPHRATGKPRGRKPNDDAALGAAVSAVAEKLGCDRGAAVKTVAGSLEGITNAESESNRRRVLRAARNGAKKQLP